MMLVTIMTNTLMGCIDLRPTNPNAVHEETDLWKQAYEEVIRQTYTECDTTTPNAYKHYGEYVLYDFDQDEIPELFLKVYEYSVMQVYDFVGNVLIQLDDIVGDAWICGVNEPNAVLCSYSATGGVEGWNILRYENGEFRSELAKYSPDASPWCEPQENPLPEKEYERIGVKYYSLDDLSGVEMYVTVQ